MKLTCLTPANGAHIDLITDSVRRWLALGGSTAGAAPEDWLHLKQEDADRSQAKPVEFTWTAPAGAMCRLHLLPDGGREWVRDSDCGDCAVSGLELGRAYRWYVSCGAEQSEVCRFTTSPDAPRLITVGGVCNVRDMGGWRIPGGRIRQGLLYRGGELETHMTVTEEGLRVLSEDLGIATDVDLRLETTLTRSLIPGAALAKLGLRAYRELIEEDSAVCKAFFDLLQQKDACPMYIHCWGGADRTGCLCFLVGAALGMTEADLFRDYELTSLAVWGERSVTSELFTGFLEALRKSGAPGDDSPTCAVKFLHAIGVTPAQLDALRERMTEKEG